MEEPSPARAVGEPSEALAAGGPRCSERPSPAERLEVGPPAGVAEPRKSAAEEVALPGLAAGCSRPRRHRHPPHWRRATAARPRPSGGVEPGPPGGREVAGQSFRPRATSRSLVLREALARPVRAKPGRLTPGPTTSGSRTDPSPLLPGQALPERSAPRVLRHRLHRSGHHQRCYARIEDRESPYRGGLLTWNCQKEGRSRDER